MKRSEEFWKLHVEALSRADISASTYAKEHGLVAKTLYRWRSLLAAKAAPTQQTNSTHPTSPPDFVVVNVADRVTEAATHCIVTLPCGLRVEMASLPQPQWLAALSRATQGA
jgi:transposase-like protein